MRIADVLFHRPAWTDDQTRVVLVPNGDLKARKRGGNNAIVPYWLKLQRAVVTLAASPCIAVL